MNANPVVSVRVGSTDLPALYRSADAVSLESQRKYLVLVGCDLLLLVCGSILAAAAAVVDVQSARIAGAGGVLLVLSLLTTAALSAKNYEQTWYGGRAMAESAKTLAWKYMMRADPFQSRLTASEVDKRFREALEAVLQQADKLAMPLSTTPGETHQITSKMRELRQAKLATRREVYRVDRVDDQQAWYSQKSAENERWEGWLFRGVMLLQFLAILASFFIIKMPRLGLAWPGVFAAGAAALIAWMQVKRHQELAQSYSVTRHELSLIAIELPNAATEEEFSEFVASAESAISREHTLWVARRDPSFARIRRRRNL